MRCVPAGTGLAGRLEGRGPQLGHARADVGARSLAGLVGLGVGCTEPRARLRILPAARAPGHVPSGLRAPPASLGVPGDARAADAGGGAGRGRRGALTQRPRPLGVQNRSLGPGRVREEGECPPLAAAAASPSVTPSVCPVYVVAAAASSARTPGARPAPPGAAAAPRGDGRRPRSALPCPRPPPFCLCVRPSAARPPALRSFCPAASPPARAPAAPALSLPGRLAVSLSLPSRFLPAPPSLPDLGSPLEALLSSVSLPFWVPPFFGSLPHRAPRSFGGVSFRTLHSPSGLLQLPTHLVRVLPSICISQSPGSFFL